MNCQNGELACPNGRKAKIEISIDGQVENLLFDAPACVKKEEITEDLSANEIKCWRFRGMTDGTVNVVHYACGKNASFQPDSSLLHNGAWLIVDGKLQIGKHYYYWSGVNKNNGEVYSRTVEAVTGDEADSILCKECLSVGCQITVTSQGGASYKSKKGNKCDFKVACDDECPPGFIKCLKLTYPGYCCLPCKSTANKINNLASKIR